MLPLPLTTSRELAIQLRRDVKPQLDAAGVKLFLVSIGTWERSIEFAEVTGRRVDWSSNVGGRGSQALGECV